MYAYLVEGGGGGGGGSALVELGQTSATGGLSAVGITLSIGHHGVLEGSKVKSAEAEAVLLLELGLLLLAVTLEPTRTIFSS